MSWERLLEDRKVRRHESSAALQLAHMVIAWSGYRVATTSGYHKTTIEDLEVALGPDAAPYAAYFDICRVKRNLVEYDSTEVFTETEAEELLGKVREFDELVAQWIRTRSD